MAENRAIRTRYPLRAVLAVGGAGLLALAELALLSVCLMPLVPLVPVFVTVMIGNACLLSAAVSYASSLARVEPVSTRRAEGRTETPKARGDRPLEAEATRAA